MVNGYHQMPDGWEWATVGECSTVITGRTPSKKDDSNYGNFMPFVKPPELLNGSIFAAEDNISEKGTKDARVLPVKSVLVSCIGNLGKTGINRVPVAFNQQINAVVFPENIIPEFGFYYFQSSEFRQALEDISSATTVAIVNKSKFESLPFPIVPLPEQERIVAKIEELFTQLEAGTSALAKVQAGLRRYEASVLKAACERKLVDDKLGIGDKPAEEVLKRFDKEPLNGEEYPTLPDGWCYTTIDSFLSNTRTGLKTGPFGSLLKKHEHREKGVSVFGIENIGKMEFIPGSKIHITEEKAKQLEGYAALPGDILISRSGTVGEVCVVPDNMGDARISTNVMRVVLNHEVISPKFFVMLFNGAPFVLDQVTELCKGSTRDFLNQTILKSIIFPLPPLEEQRRIVAEVERRLSVAREVEATVEAALVRASRLRQAVLKSAFEGRLTSSG